MADFLTVTKYAWQIYPPISPSRFFWQSLYLPADLPSHNFCWEDFLTVTKYAGRFTPQQFLLADFLTVTKYAGRFIPQFLLVDFSDSHQICQHLVTKSSGWFSPQNILLAGFMTVTKSAGRFPSGRFTDWQTWWTWGRYPPISAKRFSDSHQICWQIYLPTDLLTGRFSDSYQICCQIYFPKFMLAHISDSHSSMPADLPSHNFC